MTTFKLRRTTTDGSNDPVTTAINNWIEERWHRAHPHSRTFSPPALVNFWLMKANGEISAEEPLAIYAVLMRLIPATIVVRMVLLWGVTGSAHSFSKHSPEKALVTFCNEQHRVCSGRETLTPHIVAKTRGNLVARIKAVRARTGHTLQMLDPDDADALLRACQIAIEVKREDQKQWNP